MNLFISIALLVLGFIGTMAAFGGETWRKGDERLSHRITRRGWLSLTCLTAALILGATREVRNHSVKSGLEAQVDGLRAQVQRQAGLLSSGRLDEIRGQDSRLETTIEAVNAVRSVYQKLDESTLSIEGRARRKNAPPPFPLKFDFQHKGAAFDVCSEAFRVASGRRFETAACEAMNLPSFIEGLPQHPAFERRPMGPSVIALLQYLGTKSVAHRDALNGPFTLAEKRDPDKSLSDVIRQGAAECGVSSTNAAGYVKHATVMRNIEDSGQGLHWCFQFGFPAPHSTSMGFLRDKFSGSSAELLVQMSELDKLVRGDTSPKHDFTLGQFLKNLTTGYARLNQIMEDVSKKCVSQRQTIDEELRRIVSGSTAQ
jgi:hypothetical protein